MKLQSIAIMSIMQKSLRDDYKMHICVDIDINSKWYINIYNLDTKRNAEINFDLEDRRFESYEDALKFGIIKILESVGKNER